MRRFQDPKVLALLGLPLWGTARRTDLRSLAAAGDEVALPAGSRLQRAGTTPTECFLVLDGTAAPSGRPGDIIGVPEALDGATAPTDVVATSELRALVLTPARLRALVETNHIVRAAVFRQLVTQARAAMQLAAAS